MKQLMGIAFIVIFTLNSGQNLFAETEIAGFSKAIVNSDIDFRTYDTLFVEKVNMDGVKLEGTDLFFDDEGGGLLGEEEEKEDIGYKYRMIFAGHFKKVIPVLFREMNIKNEKEMGLRIKIKGELKETRLLENLIPGVENRNTKVAIEGYLFDLGTKEELAYFYDERISAKKEEDESIFDRNDMEEWNNEVNLWAKYLADFLAAKRGELYVFSDGK